jgi:hypothetical protein
MVTTALLASIVLALLAAVAVTAILQTTAVESGGSLESTELLLGRVAEELEGSVDIVNLIDRGREALVGLSGRLVQSPNDPSAFSAEIVQVLLEHP